MTVAFDHEENNNRFVMKIGDEAAEVTYNYDPVSRIHTFWHTEVPHALRGRGYAAQVSKVLQNCL